MIVKSPWPVAGPGFLAWSLPRDVCLTEVATNRWLSRWQQQPRMSKRRTVFGRTVLIFVKFLTI